MKSLEARIQEIKEIAEKLQPYIEEYEDLKLD
jgi:hypothetical protein